MKFQANRNSNLPNLPNLYAAKSPMPNLKMKRARDIANPSSATIPHE
jgi:hypothetical protein